MANKKPIKSLDALGKVFGIEPTPIPETVGFLGRENELQTIQTFLKSDKRVLEISGVPMIGKSTLVMEYCQRHKLDTHFVYFRDTPYTPVADLQNHVGKDLNNFSDIPKQTVLVIENFEQALDWIPDEENLHKVKDNRIHLFIQGVITEGLKLILVSRFKTKFDAMHRRFVQTIPLKGVDTGLFWELYAQKNFDQTAFDTLCKQFDAHTGLLALAYRDAEWLYEDDLLRAVHNPFSTTKALWKLITHITQALKTEEKYILSALTLWRMPKTKADIGNALLSLAVHKLDDCLFSLRQKLLVQETNAQNDLEYALNPYLAEVYYTFMQNDKSLEREFLAVKNLPAFQKIDAPVYDDLLQAHKQGDFPTFYKLINQKRKAKQFDSLIESLQKIFFEDSRPEAILNEIGITYKWAGKNEEAKKTFERALKLNSDNVKILNELSIIYKAEGNLTKAKEILEKAMELGNLHSYNELSIIYKAEGNLTKAKEILEKAINLGHIPAMNELAIVYKTEGKLTKAKEILEKAMELGNLHSYNELAIIYREEGNLTKAKEILEKAMKLKHAPAFNILARILLQEGSYAEALKMVEEGLGIDSDSSHLEKTKTAIIDEQADKAKKKESETAGEIAQRAIEALDAYDLAGYFAEMKKLLPTFEPSDKQSLNKLQKEFVNGMTAQNVDFLARLRVFAEMVGQ